MKFTTKQIVITAMFFIVTIGVILFQVINNKGNVDIKKGPILSNKFKTGEESGSYNALDKKLVQFKDPSLNKLLKEYNSFNESQINVIKKVIEAGDNDKLSRILAALVWNETNAGQFVYRPEFNGCGIFLQRIQNRTECEKTIKDPKLAIEKAYYHGNMLNNIYPKNSNQMIIKFNYGINEQASKEAEERYLKSIHDKIKIIEYKLKENNG